MISAGQSIGNYRILNKIGTGGMGAVYLAEHPLIGKRVALKVIHRELASNRDVVSRFFQEARAVNKIGNEHIVEIHDFGQTPEGDHFFIMEYLEGQTLASVLAREAKVEIMRALHIGAQIAGALAAAHTAGIIHRDVKPDNIMLMARLGDRDFVKVLDFGLAKVFSAETAVKTAAGVLLGTPQYMSPEACESKGDVDHRTDIYALGVLLFQMTTGVLPFNGESMGEVLVKQVTALPPAPRGVNPAIPPSVEQILLRCLAKRMDARFATMMQLREALLDPEAYLRGSPPIAPASSVSRRDAASDSSPAIAPGAAQPRPQPHEQRTRLAMDNPLAARTSVPAAGIAGAPTMIADHGERIARRAGGGMPALALPQEPTMNTMRIATPHGYSSRPPRKLWPVVFALAVLLGIGTGIAVTRPGDSKPPGDGSAGASGAEAARPATQAASTGAGPAVKAAPSATPAVPASDGIAAAGTGSAAASRTAATSTTVAGGAAIRPSVGPVVRLARLSIDSVPQGAAVIGPDGALLGTTPLKIEWPISDLPVMFELALVGYQKKQLPTVVSGNTAVNVPLERVPVIRRGGGKASGGGANRGSRSQSGSASSRNGLMRPD